MSWLRRQGASQIIVIKKFRYRKGLWVPGRDAPLSRVQGNGQGEDDGGEDPVSWGGTCEVLESCKDCQGTGISAVCGNCKITCMLCLGLGRVLVERCCVIG
jgi:hypothetical protein